MSIDSSFSLSGGKGGGGCGVCDRTDWSSCPSRASIESSFCCNTGVALGGCRRCRVMYFVFGRGRGRGRDEDDFRLRGILYYYLCNYIRK